MDRASVIFTKSILSWVALIFCPLLAVRYLQDVGWVSSQTVDIAVWHQIKFVTYAIALLIAGVTLFGGIRALPRFGKVRTWILIVSALIALAPNAWEFLKIDSCLDSGGAWDYLEFKCDK